jgi:hypothetical protein
VAGVGLRFALLGFSIGHAVFPYLIMKYSSIIVRAFQSQSDFDNNSGCVVEFTFDTIKEAKARAKYYLTEEYRKSSEAADRLQYSQVVADGQCVADFFGK